MVVTIATCGHEIELEWAMNGGAVWVKDYARDCSRVASYRVLCPDCLERYHKEKMVLETEAQKRRWLRIKPIGSKKRGKKR